MWAVREGASFFHKSGGEPTQLTVGPLMFSNPTPSPDGKKLVVIGQQRRFDLIGLNGKSQQFSLYLPSVAAGRGDSQTHGGWGTDRAAPGPTLWRRRARRRSAAP